MDVYIYCADIYCEDCGRAIRQRYFETGTQPRHPHDESTYDSDEFPKGPYPDGGGEADCPQHCGSGADCVNAYTPDGWKHKVGCFLENDLTADGAQHVVESFLDDPDNPVVAQHARYYADCGYELEAQLNGLRIRLG